MPQKTAPKSAKKPTDWLTLYIASLSILLIVLLGSLFVEPTSKPIIYPEFSHPEYTTQVKPLIVERQFQAAIDELETLVVIYPTSAQPLIYIGQIYLMQHRWLMAEDAFNRALARDADHAWAMAGLAETMLQQGRLTSALVIWQEVAEVNPTMPGLASGLGRTYLLQGNFESAEAAFRQQSDTESHWYLAALTAPRDLVTARNYLYAMSPSRNSYWQSQRDYLLELLASFDQNTPPAEVAQTMGVALSQIGEWPLASHALNQALDLQGDTPNGETVAFLAKTQAQLGRPAFELFEEARRIAPESALVLYMQGRYLREQGALRAARRTFAEAVIADPENAATYIEMGITRAEQGNLTAAEAWYLEALQVAENKAPFELLLARFYVEHNYQLTETGLPYLEAFVKATPLMPKHTRCWAGCSLSLATRMRLKKRSSKLSS